ncbi:hypothetical protein L1987_64096 [Smallanthus sonchifolius]|uniref:Uncharacterized protein n=1 Tax=Smallanthus sonchifolius TaxID=185202 RepID=A0ACB9CF65_9ASTR|nr:hypothetical protein L1987_64096 [Smallanthus sonchifolius]
MIFLNDVEIMIVDVNSQSQFDSWHLSDLVVGHGKQDALRLLLKQGKQLQQILGMLDDIKELGSEAVVKKRSKVYLNKACKVILISHLIHHPWLSYSEQAKDLEQNDIFLYVSSTVIIEPLSHVLNTQASDHFFETFFTTVLLAGHDSLSLLYA